MKRINVTNSFLPPFEEYQEYTKKIWESNHLTNSGPLSKDFEQKIKEYLDTENFKFVANGTLALQISLEALDIREGEVITTPFTYVATTSAILWQRCKPVYVDIDPETLNIDATKIEAAITQKTKAILPVHVFGNPCDVDKIEEIAKKHKLKVMYDAAHAFGVKYKDKSILSYGDISICSFHATKSFHTIEGGGVVAQTQNTIDKIELLKRFGHHRDDYQMLGINAKANEFQAAMGLANLKYIESNIKSRMEAVQYYDELLRGTFEKPRQQSYTEHNYSYYPVLFKNEELLLKAIDRLEGRNIFPRRYFFPSLNTLPYLEARQHCPVSEDVSSRILCLPLYAGIEKKIIKEICETLK